MNLNLFSKLIVLLFLVLIISCKIQNVNIGDVQGLKLNEVKKDYVNLEFMLPIENPNDFKFAITKVDLDIALNKSELGKIKKIEKVVVPAHSKDVHSFIIEVEYKKLMAGTVSLIGGLIKNKAEIKIDGYIKVRAFGIIGKKIEIHENNPVKFFNDKK
jgi:LEA14-like dessication related protein